MQCLGVDTSFGKVVFLSSVACSQQLCYHSKLLNNFIGPTLSNYESLKPLELLEYENNRAAYV